jgi:hypothetical protein
MGYAMKRLQGSKRKSGSAEEKVVGISGFSGHDSGGVDRPENIMQLARDDRNLVQ